jgi:beta-glucosidase
VSELGDRASQPAQTFFDLPVCLTETSDGRTDEEKAAYAEALFDMAGRLRAEQVPLKGLFWWPLFETIQWDYREKSDQPLTDFIYPGGWNNGLYTIEPETDGQLTRVGTSAVPVYRKLIRRELDRSR